MKLETDVLVLLSLGMGITPTIFISYEEVTLSKIILHKNRIPFKFEDMWMVFLGIIKYFILAWRATRRSKCF